MPKARPARAPVSLFSDSDWTMVQRRPPSVTRIQAQNTKALERGESPRARRTADPRRRKPERVVFRNRATKERVVLRRDERRWTLLWKGAETNLDHPATIETADKGTWIVQAPYSESDGRQLFPHPVRPAPALASTLSSAWFRLFQDSSWPLVEATERRRIISAVRVIRALHEAVKHDDSPGRRLILALDTQAARYLKARGRENWANMDEEKKGWARERHVAEELTLVGSRPVVLERLVESWFNHLTEPARDVVGAIERCIDDFRRISLFQNLAAELTSLESAGVQVVEEIGMLFNDAREELKAKRRESLCEKCAPGEGGLGKEGRVQYTAPVPGDVDGWGCRGGPCGPLAEAEVDQFAAELARRFVGAMLVALGLPRNKVRSLFDYERAGWERSVGKRAKRGRAQSNPTP